MDRVFRSKRDVGDFAKRIFGAGAVERAHYSVLPIGAQRYLISNLNRFSDEEWAEICRQAEQATDYSGVVQIDVEIPHHSAFRLETAVVGDMMLPVAARTIGRFILPEEPEMAKKPDPANKGKSKPPAGKFTPGDNKGPPKAKTPADPTQTEEGDAPAFAKEPADPKAGKPAKAPKAEKAPKAPKPPKEPAGPRALSPKMQQMLDLAMGPNGLTHKDICDITGSTNPPQTQIVERLRKHVDGTLDKARPEGARGFIYKIVPGKNAPAPAAAAPAAEGDATDVSDGAAEGEGTDSGETGDENGDGESPDAGESADTVAGAEAAA